MGTDPAGEPPFHGRDDVSPGHTELVSSPAAVVPEWGPPPAAPRARRRWLPLLLVIALIASVCGGAYWYTQQRGPSYPKHWDPRVADLVSFVETERGLKFDHPVTVDFVPVRQFKRELTTSAETLTPADRKQVRDAVAFLRALGLVEGKVDLLKAVNQAQSEGVLAYYDPKDEKIRIRGTRLDVSTRVTLVHEMTHALQDQHFDLTELRKLDHDDESGAITALIEGDATEVENAYVASLPRSDRARYETQSQKASDDADFDGIPPVIQIMFGAPYEFGPALVQVLRADGGVAALDAAFVKPPTDQEQIFDPMTYVHHDTAEHVTTPRVPAGAKKGDSGTFEPLGWYVVLSERIDAHQALRAADGWGGDAYVDYRTRDGRACTRIRYRGEHVSDTDEMHDALQAWIDALPTKTASVRDEGATLLFESCDPGTGVHVATGRSLDAINVPVARATFIEELLKENVPVDVAACVGDAVAASYTVAELSDDSGAAFRSAAGRQRLVDIAATCRATNG